MSGGQYARGTPSTSQSGTLKATLLVTNKGGSLLLKEIRAQPLADITSIETARRGEFVTAIVLFSGCTPDKEGLCNATPVIRD